MYRVIYKKDSPAHRIPAHWIVIDDFGSTVCECYQSEDTCQRIADSLNALAGEKYPAKFVENMKFRDNNLIKQRDELEARIKAISAAYSQYTFFIDGYRNGSASISEVNAAQSEFLILLNGNDN